jgi:hypothetical protein
MYHKQGVKPIKTRNPVFFEFSIAKQRTFIYGMSLEYFQFFKKIGSPNNVLSVETQAILSHNMNNYFN